MLVLIGYLIWYSTDPTCGFNAFSVYHCLLIVLLCIDFYYEQRLLHVLYELTNTLRRISSKELSLDEDRIRLLIYRFSEQTTREALTPPNETQCRKITFFFALLAFIGQLSFLSRHQEFACYFQGETLIVNATVWAAYIALTFAFRMANSVGKSFLFQCAIEGKHFHNDSIESLEIEWKIRSSYDYIIPNSANSNAQLSQCQIQQQLQSNCSFAMQQVPILEPLNANQAPAIAPEIINEQVQQQEQFQKQSEEREEQAIKTPRKEGKEEIECQICLMGFIGGSVSRQMKCCKKIFHYECCLSWFLDKPTCPNCRALPSSLIEDPDDSNQQQNNIENLFIQEFLGKQMLQQQQEAQLEYPQQNSLIKTATQHPLNQQIDLGADAVGAASGTRKNNPSDSGVMGILGRDQRAQQKLDSIDQEQVIEMTRTIQIKDKDASFIDSIPLDELKKEFQQNHSQSQPKYPSHTKLSNRIHIEPIRLKSEHQKK